MMIRRNGKGTVLIAVLIMLTFVSVLALSLVAILKVRSEESSLELDRLRALYLAEAGIAKAIYELRWDRDPDGNGIGNVKRIQFAGGFYRAAHNFQTSTITGTGTFNDVRRIVQIKYSSL